jgi:hypothetical protein
MSGLRFHFADVINEIVAIEKVAEPFLEAHSLRHLQQLRTMLGNLQVTAHEKTVRLEIPAADPLVTRISFGSYQTDDQGAHNVFAELSCVWEIRRIPPKGKKAAKADVFELTGLASTAVRVFKREADGAKGPLEALWRMEIGDSESPGCHFHVQVMGETDDRPFRKSIDVPRLPGVLVTPPSVIEFVLGELFQKAWVQHASAQTPHLQRWIPIQQRRLTAVLGWHADVVSRAISSPWSTLKKAKPDPGLFLS